MKKTLGIVAASALAIGAFGAPVAAAPADAACFGQVHKTLNTAGTITVKDGEGETVAVVSSVNDVVRAFGGPGKNGAARAICAGDLTVEIS